LIWLIAALVALAVEGVALSRGAWNASRWAAIAMYAALAVMILATAGDVAFSKGEAGLLGWFVFGLATLAAGTALAFKASSERRSRIAVPIAAAMFALGLDVTRPDEYAFVPAAILGAMVAAVVWRAHTTLAPLNGKKPSTVDRVGLVIKIALVGVLVFAGIYKVIDRGWPLPWSYLVAGGALLFAGAQLRLGLERLQGREKTRRKELPTMWVWASDAAVAAIVVASYFIYIVFL
jgi:hypothetical protein